MDQLLSQISGYGPAGVIIAVLVYFIRVLLIRYDQIRTEQLKQMEADLVSRQTNTAALENAAKALEQFRLSNEALRLRLGSKDKT